MKIHQPIRTYVKMHSTNFTITKKSIAQILHLCNLGTFKYLIFRQMKLLAESKWRLAI